MERDLSDMRDIKILFLLNALDAALTLIWISTGASTEANPLMAWLLAHGAVPFLAIKLALGLIVCASLYACRYTTAGYRVTQAGISAYGLAIAAHLLVFRF